jgi:hypothetical protein
VEPRKVGDRAAIDRALGGLLGRVALLEPGVGSIPDPRASTHDHRLTGWTLTGRSLGADCWLVESRAGWEWIPR